MTTLRISALVAEISDELDIDVVRAHVIAEGVAFADEEDEFFDV